MPATLITVKDSDTRLPTDLKASAGTLCIIRDLKKKQWRETCIHVFLKYHKKLRLWSDKLPDL